MRHSPSRFAVLVALIGVALMSVLIPVASQAAPTADDAVLSGVSVADGQLTGTLTHHSASAIDPGALTATVGGKPASVQVAAATQIARTTMIVIDTSGSMGTEGMATVRSAVQTFLANVPADVKVGVVSFANTAGVDVAPTTDRAAVQTAVDSLVSRGETALYQAIDIAVGALGATGERNIVLLSDGGDTVSALSGGDEAAARARTQALLTASKVRMEIVAFKSAEERPEILSGFASAGGGSVAPAADAAAVNAAFGEAARVLERQQAVTITLPAGASGTADVALTGTAAGVPFRAALAVDLGAAAETAAPSSSPSPTVVPEPTSSAQILPTFSPGLFVALAVLVVGVFGLVLSFFAPAFRSKRAERLAAIQAYAADRPIRRAAAQVPTSGQLLDLGERVMAGRESTGRTMALIDRADLPWRAGEWLLIRILAVLVGTIVGYLYPGGFLGVLLGAVLGFAVPWVGLRWLAKRRANRFEAVLPDVMMLTATSLASGFSLLQALDAVARDAAEPAAKEISRALAEARIGSDVSDALDHVAVRMDSESLRWTTMAIRIQRDVGGNLAETLRTTAATLRERESLKRHVRALSAEGRLSAYILIAMPIAILLYSMVVNYDYISLLWTSGMGLLMCVGGVLAMIAGVFWMRSIVNIEV